MKESEARKKFESIIKKRKCLICGGEINFDNPGLMIGVSIENTEYSKNKVKSMVFLHKGECDYHYFEHLRNCKLSEHFTVLLDFDWLQQLASHYKDNDFYAYHIEKKAIQDFKLFFKDFYDLWKELR